MMHAEALIILSNIDGIYNGNPSDPASEVIREITPEGNFTKYIQTGKSSFGRGGMLTKYNIARKVSQEGIYVIIANGKREGILTDLIKKDCTIPHTTFMANQKKASGVKKWIAHSESFAKGYVVLNEGATEALTSKASSVLLVGITEVGGEFVKGDIVKILNQDKEELGVGIAQYDMIPVLQQNVGGKELMKAVEGLAPTAGQMQIGLSVDVGEILCAEEGLGAGHLCQSTGSTAVIEVPVGVDDVLDILGIKAQLMDVLDHQIQAQGIAGIDEDQSVAGIDEVGAGGLGAAEIKVA
jgi:hypothetical protein